MRVAIVGFGTIALGHTTAYGQVAELDLVAAVDPQPERRRVAEGLGLRAYATLEEMLLQEDVAVLDICTPPKWHSSYIRNAVAHGLHAVCEKPVLVEGSAGYTDLIDTVLRSGCVLYPAHNYKFAPAIQELQRTTSRPEFGDVLEAHFRTLRSGHARGVVEWCPDWRRDPVVACGGVLRDHATHSVYLALLLTRLMPVEVSCTAGRMRDDQFHGTEDSAWLRIRCQGGAQILIDVSWAARERNTYYAVSGSGGTVRIENDELHVTQNGQVTTKTLKSDFDDPSHVAWFEQLLRDFLDVLGHRQRQKPLIAEALICALVVDAAYESAAEGGAWVKIPQILYQQLRAPDAVVGDGHAPTEASDPVTPGEAEWHQRALLVDARAATRPDIISDESGRQAYPRYAIRAEGAYVWDAGGKRYIDYLLGYGPAILGHADLRVERAVVEQLRLGNVIAPLWSPRQVELCELLSSVVPGAERVHLLKTGSDANSAAIRLARIFTGRSKVLRSGYNGWHDWASDLPAGIPPAVRAECESFDFNDPEDLEGRLSNAPGQVACVVTTPFHVRAISASHLEELRSIAHKHGALFVLDEMRTGFRLALGGAQEYFGVQADLATFSKAMANGYPISAVTGRAEVMQCLARTRISSTFYAGPVEMAAALTTVSVLQNTDTLIRVAALGERLMTGLREILSQYHVPATVVGYPSIPFLEFHASPVGDWWKDRFFRATTAGGILFHPDHQWFLSASHTSTDIDVTLAVCRQASYELAGEMSL